jgi:purine-binding chemotaxis protein CheW
VSVHVLLRVGGEAYALPVENVREVAELGAVTALPGAPATVLGVVNVRGKILPVYELAAVLGIERGHGERQVLLVAEHAGRDAGLAVDGVEGVEPLPEATEETDSPLLRGAVLEGDQLIGLLDAAALLDALEEAAA